MFSGKTEELLRRMKRAEIARLGTLLVKPTTDTRYDATRVVSHNRQKGDAIPIQSAKDIFDLIDHRTEVVGIDEAQFFTNDLIETVTKLANRGMRVIVAGLDLDFAARPFGPIPELLAIAEEVHKIHAICTKCGDDASRSQRLTKEDAVVALGASESYEARCRACFEPPL